jgi:hypothetical protein
MIFFFANLRSKLSSQRGELPKREKNPSRRRLTVQAASKQIIHFYVRMVGPDGFEPPTKRL